MLERCLIKSNFVNCPFHLKAWWSFLCFFWIFKTIYKYHAHIINAIYIYTVFAFCLCLKHASMRASRFDMYIYIVFIFGTLPTDRLKLYSCQISRSKWMITLFVPPKAWWVLSLAFRPPKECKVCLSHMQSPM